MCLSGKVEGGGKKQKTKQSHEPAGAERNRKCGLAPLHEIKKTLTAFKSAGACVGVALCED